MKVKDLIEHLQKCNQEAFVTFGLPLTDGVDDIDHVVELGYCDTEEAPSVCLYSNYMRGR